MDVFLEKFRRGEGGHIWSKNYIADFVGFKTVYFGRKFWKKCPKRGGRGGGHLQSKKSLQFFGKLTDILQIFAKKAQWRILGNTDAPYRSPPPLFLWYILFFPQMFFLPDLLWSILSSCWYQWVSWTASLKDIMMMMIISPQCVPWMKGYRLHSDHDWSVYRDY